MPRMRIALLLFPTLLALLLPLAAAGEVRLATGDVEGGGRFSMAVPQGWQPGDALILYLRGFTLRSDVVSEDPRLAPDEALLAEWLDRGYAVASGSYAQRGWAVFDGGAHQHALLARFVAEAGQPGRIVLVGGSLGGLLAVKTAEQFIAAGQPVDGIFALCPAFAGARTWDRAADLKLAYDAVCAGVGGGEIDRGSSAPAWIPDLAQVPADWGDQTDPEVQRLAARLLQCTGVLLPDWARSSGQRARLATLMEAFGLTDEDFLLTNLGYATFALSDLVRGPDKLRGASPFDNRFVSYADPALDAAIARVAADPYARAELSVLSDPNWRLGDARLLALHTSRDELIVPEHLSLLQPLAKASATVATALVAEASPSHCAFSSGEFVGGFNALEAWMDGGPEPDIATLEAHCHALPATTADGVPHCRFASAEGLGAYASRVPERGLPAHAPVTAAASGAWYDPATSGEGFFVQVLPERGTVAVSWYTFAPDGSGAPAWIVGLGQVGGNAILVQDARSYRGGGFGADFDPATLGGEPWGRLTFVLEEPLPGSTLRQGRVRYEGPAGWGSGERLLTQLTHDGCGGRADCNAATLPLHGYSGLWYRGPQASGDGLFFQVDANGQAVLAWYLFTPGGEPLWLTGVAGRGGGDAVQFALTQASGARFGSGFDPAAVERRRWGEATLRFHDCGSATLEWQADAAGFPDGSLALQRLTPAPPGSSCP